MFKTAIIYKRDANGSIRTWQGEALNGSWRSIAGVLNGNPVTSEWSEAPPKSKATAYEQAIFECTAQHDKLLSKDYRTSIELVDVPRGSFIKPMLAQKYEGYNEPCYIQPKLDGMRCLANVDGLWSRGAKPIVSAPHIVNQLQTIFKLYPNLVLDGELYNHTHHDDFNGLMSILKKTRCSEADLNKSAIIVQYHVYDMFMMNSPDKIFSDRNSFLRGLQELSLFGASVKLVETYVSYEEQLKEHHMLFVEEGYEGSMIRLDKPYEQKRSKTLMKNKDFITEEFTLLRIEEGEGNWKGYAKRAVCRTPEGVEFGAGIKGDQAFCQTLLKEDVSTFQSVTIRHFGKTPDGSIRFPIAISFNERNSIENRPVLDINSHEEEM